MKSSISKYLESLKHVVQVRGFDAGLEVDVSTFRLVVVSAVAADAGHHGLTLLHSEPVLLIGLGVGFHVGLVMAAVGLLVAIRMAFPPSALEYFSAFAFAPPASQYAFWAT